jgi:hypothetical protein
MYNSARSDVGEALKAYAMCLGNDDGHDDCDSEFNALKAAQDDFETAVSSYGSDCS